MHAGLDRRAFFYHFHSSNELVVMDLVRLIADRDERYTMLQQVKDHPWFAGLDWTMLRDMVRQSAIFPRHSHTERKRK